MTPRFTLAYRRPVLGGGQLLGAEGTPATAHEFHRTTVTPVHGDRPAWSVDDVPVGFAGPTPSASYLHVHWAGHPGLAQGFTDAGPAADTPVRTPTAPHATVPAASDAVPADPLRHHGDAEATAGLADFAVNVSRLPRPAWLEAALREGLACSTRYPDARAGHDAVARRHGRDRAEVLVTSGAAEAFFLMARARAWRRPAVVHPQFTEPDVALRAAGHKVVHVLCDPEDGFALDPARVPDDADLVVVGNPTNPTGRLHPADTVRALVRPGRVVVVDEAFMDFVPGEPETLTAHRLPGVAVVRSLTKLWSMPGIRAGYVVGDAAVVAELREQQPPWSVSAPALTAVIATAGPAAATEQEHRARRVARERRVLVDGLTELGIEVIDSQAPFVLARLGRGTHTRLRAAGIAVRRADTFPGLDHTRARIAVRESTATRHLLIALRTVRSAWS